MTDRRSDLPDVSLLEAWRTGDEAAGNALVDRHFKSVYRFFRRKLDQGCEDLVQSTFLACVEGRDVLRQDVRFKAYLFAIARKQLVSHLRRQAMMEAKAGKAEVRPATLTSPSKAAALRQEQRLLIEALRALPLDLQLVVELHYWEQLTTTEIAAIVDVAQGTVKWRLSRARDLLREHIQNAKVPVDLSQSTLRDLDAWARSLRDLDPE